jgi:hypothetical protein
MRLIQSPRVLYLRTRDENKARRQAFPQARARRGIYITCIAFHGVHYSFVVMGMSVRLDASDEGETRTLARRRWNASVIR